MRTSLFDSSVMHEPHGRWEGTPNRVCKNGQNFTARDAGCGGYIPKPIEKRAFINTIQYFLGTPQEGNDALITTFPRE